MDKTFSETQGVNPFDWNAELNALIAGKKLTNKEFSELCKRSLSWTTCACGNQCAIIPRAEGSELDETDYPILKGAPLDYILRQHGVNFYECIQLEMWREAKEELIEIEMRAAILIREELAALNTP